MTGKGNHHRRVDVLEANRQPRPPADEQDATPLIWEVLERYPRVKAQAEIIKGIRTMDDDEAVSHLLEVLDDHPEVKAAVVERLKQVMESSQ